MPNNLTTTITPAPGLTPTAQQGWLNGISQAEGFGLPNATPTLANNPGDLRLGDIGYGTINGITVYPSVQAGTDALANQVNHFYNPPPGSPYNPNMTIGQIAQTYTGGDNPAGWSATVAKNLGTTTYATPGQASSGAVPSQNSVQISQTLIDPADPNPDPILASALPQIAVSDEAYQALQPQMIVTEDLNNQAWYQDTNLLTGNPKLQKQGIFPVTFVVFMDRNNSSSILSNSQTQQPIVLALNCSLTRFNQTSRHIVNKQDTRTGFFLTMWGMAADMISGEGSTGVFLNQFGVTDFLSLTSPTSDSSALVAMGFQGQPSQDRAQAAALAQQPEAFRIAAQDAFIEFLSLFKMNGTTYLNPSGYGFDTRNVSTTDNVNPNNTSFSLYSQNVGASSQEIKGRNNDVYRRGYVVMRFRNSQYLGYFKSLNWQLDANNPYQWKFNFVFQVEETLTVAYYPQQPGVVYSGVPSTTSEVVG
jgi:hypothetical protein